MAWTVRGRKALGKGRAALVRRELDRDTAPAERDGQGLGREQVAAGAAGAEQDERAGSRRFRRDWPSCRSRKLQARAMTSDRGRRRVKASRKPIA